MQVKLLVAHAGRKPGDVYETDEAEALRMISGRWALPIVDKKVERAVKKPARETRKK